VRRWRACRVWDSGKVKLKAVETEVLRERLVVVIDGSEVHGNGDVG
jgi:regulator of extracellular matrix RemA (YlzA/DUF370 family)